MPDILIRGLNAKAVNRLKIRAKRNGRSLQSEAKRLLENVANDDELKTMFAKWRRTFKDRKLTDSVALIREDRER